MTVLNTQNSPILNMFNARDLLSRIPLMNILIFTKLMQSKLIMMMTMTQLMMMMRTWGPFFTPVKIRNAKFRAPALLVALLLNARNTKYSMMTSSMKKLTFWQ